MRLFPTIEEGVKLLVTDIRMPGLAGTELAHELKVKQRDLPVLFVSGHCDELDLLSLRPEEWFLSKPFTTMALQLGVGALLAHWLPKCSACGETRSKQAHIEDDGLTVVVTSTCLHCSAKTNSAITRGPNSSLGRCPIDDGPVIPSGYGFVGPNEYVWNGVCLACHSSMQSRSPHLKGVPW
ncbi:MAG: response regulator [Acidobacteriota bacterium]|nr:response regulator [Acidobacteriota bacterium]